MRLLPAALALSCALALAACGAEQARLPDPNSRLGSPPPTRRAEFPRAGLTLRVPLRVEVMRRRLPGVFRFTLPSGAVVSALAYRRREPLPVDDAALRAARRRLVRAVRRRDPDFGLTRARAFSAGGARGIEIVGRQTLSGGRLDTRSVHLFKGNGEYVFELLAPGADFGPANALAFEPMVRSVKLDGSVQAARESRGAP